MSGTFSITGPRITDEQDAAERDSLTAEELKALHDDIRGKSSLVYTETAEMKRSACEAVQQAIDLIGLNQKQAYLRALHVCPNLVATETEPIRFIRSVDYNPWEAAQKIVDYWECRRKIFMDRPFAPLAIRSGALSDDTVAFLDRKIWVRGADDANHRAIIYFDRSQLENNERYRNAALQTIFYVFCATIEESEDAQKNGIVIIINGKVYIVSWLMCTDEYACALTLYRYKFTGQHDEVRSKAVSTNVRAFARRTSLSNQSLARMCTSC